MFPKCSVASQDLDLYAVELDVWTCHIITPEISMTAKYYKKWIARQTPKRSLSRGIAFDHG